MENRSMKIVLVAIKVIDQQVKAAKVAITEDLKVASLTVVAATAVDSTKTKIKIIHHHKVRKQIQKHLLFLLQKSLKKHHQIVRNSIKIKWWLHVMLTS